MNRIDYKTPFAASLLNLGAMSGRWERWPHSLNKAVQSAVAMTDEGRVKPIRGGFLHAKPILAVMVYCYASEVYSSAEIQAHLARDANFARLAQNDVPSVEAICRFRSENRDIIQRCLESTLRFVAGTRHDLAGETDTDEGFIREEARRRVIMAVCTDRLEMEAAKALAAA